MWMLDTFEKKARNAITVVQKFPEFMNDDMFVVHLIE